jgi:hypothetical protein
MKRVLAALALVALMLVPTSALAAGPKVRIDAPLPVQGTLNGAPFLFTSTTTSVQGDVCMPQTVYQGPFSRYQFQGWYDNGTLLSQDACMTVSSGSYLAHFALQYMVTVTYSPLNVVQETDWVNAGDSIEVTVGTTINGSGYSYSLQQVLVSGTPVYAPGGTLQVSADGPVLVQAVYNERVNVTVVQPGGSLTRFLPAGVPWFHSFTESIPAGNGSSLRLNGVSVFGTSSYDVSGNVLSLTPTAPVIVTPIYGTYYYMKVTDPSGVVRRGWYERGNLLNVTVPSQIPVNDQERLVFSGWRGANGTNDISVPVTAAANISAVYTTEYQITQSSPLGTTTQWSDAGSTAAVFFPTTLTASLGFTRTLSSVLVDGTSVANDHGAVVVSVSGPVQVVAVYSYAPDYVFIGLIAAVVAVVLLGYYVRLRFENRGPKPEGSQPASAKPAAEPENPVPPEPAPDAKAPSLSAAPAEADRPKDEAPRKEPSEPAPEPAVEAPPSGAPAAPVSPAPEAAPEPAPEPKTGPAPEPAEQQPSRSKRTRAKPKLAPAASVDEIGALLGEVMTESASLTDLKAAEEDYSSRVISAIREVQSRVGSPIQFDPSLLGDDFLDAKGAAVMSDGNCVVIDASGERENLPLASLPAVRLLPIFREVAGKLDKAQADG